MVITNVSRKYEFTARVKTETGQKNLQVIIGENIHLVLDAQAFTFKVGYGKAPWPGLFGDFIRECVPGINFEDSNKLKCYVYNKL